MAQLLLDSEVAKVSVDEALNLGIIEWKNKVTPETYASAFQSLLDFAENKRNIYYFLSDIRNQGIVGPENRKWFETVALPKAISLGLKKAATIMDGNIFKKYYINMILSVSSKFDLPLKVVSSKEEAFDFFGIEEFKAM